MDGRGGCCIARYSAAGGGGGGGGFGEISYGMSKVERIMLKFRPIAPKPTATGSGSSSTVEHSHSYDGTPRRKRKYVRANGGKTKKKEKISTVSKKKKASPSSSSVSGSGNAVVTLSLMPETPDRKEKSPSTSSPTEINRDILSPIHPAINHQLQMISADHAVLNRKSRVISVVTVENWMNGDGLGFIEKARVMNMEMETCPSFITNDRDAVVWTNKAYKEMTAAGGDSEETTVVIVKKINLPETQPWFTCRVKVTWGNEGDTSPAATITAPCDVWQLRTGGYAWRLDIKAALCLGR